MKRNLFTQLLNEWRDNIWLVIELLLVSAVIWFIGMILYSLVGSYYTPRGFDYDNVYTLNVKYISEKSPYYTTIPEDEESPYSHDRAELLRRLINNPHVEATAFHQNAVPYNYNYSGWLLNRFDTNDTIPYYGNVRRGTPGIVRVLNYKSRTGKTTEQLEEMLRNGQLLISDSRAYSQNGVNPEDLVGTRVILGGDSSKIYTVGDLIQNVRRTDYEGGWGGTIVIPQDEKITPSGDIVLRIHQGHEMRFKEDFRNDPTLRRQRNIYLSDLQSLSDIRRTCQHDTDTTVHTFETVMFFLLVTVFLGMLGAFWFRIQQRVSEIAMRKVCGATRNDIFRRVITEGLILLAVAALLMSLLAWPFMGDIKPMLDVDTKVVIIIELITLAIVALGIIASLWAPARRAMKIEPAIALKGE